MADKTPLKYVVNPCDLDRHKALVGLGDGVAKLWNLLTTGTECPCCLGFRLLGALAVAGALGFWLGRL